MPTILKAGNVTSGGSFTPDSAGTLEIKTGTGVGTTAITVDASQNVGVGTSSPSSYANYTSLSINGTDSDIDLLRGGVRQFGLYTTSFLTALNNVANLPIAFYTNNTEQARLTAAGLFQFNSGYGSVATAYGCRAWVNFNGTGTVAIRASGNVTSITDNGVGDYTVNFTNAMPDTNYAPTISGDFAQGSGNLGNGMYLPTNYVFATSSLRTQTTNSTGTLTDIDTICFAIFR